MFKIVTINLLAIFITIGILGAEDVRDQIFRSLDKLQEELSFCDADADYCYGVIFLKETIVIEKESSSTIRFSVNAEIYDDGYDGVEKGICYFDKGSSETECRL